MSARTDFWTSAAAVVGYIVLSLFTKYFLTWTWGPIYFIVTLEIIPRVVHRLRSST